jgi:hypothetical protein
MKSPWLPAGPIAPGPGPGVVFVFVWAGAAGLSGSACEIRIPVVMMAAIAANVIRFRFIFCSS